MKSNKGECRAVSSDSDRKGNVSGKKHVVFIKTVTVIGVDDPNETALLYSACPEGSGFEIIDSFADPGITEIILNSAAAVLDIQKEGDELFRNIERIQKENRAVKIILIGGLDRQTSALSFPSVFSIIKRPLYHDVCSDVFRQAIEGGYLYEKRIEPRVAVNLPVEVYFINRFWQGETSNISLNGMQTRWGAESETEAIPEHRNPGSGNTVRKKTGNLLPAACMQEAQTAFIKLYTSGRIGPDEEHINLKGEARYKQFSDNKLEARIGFEFRDLDLDLKMKLFSALEQK